MAAPFTLLPFIEEAGNRLLRLDPETLHHLGDMQGQVVCVEFRELGRKIYLHPSESGFRLASVADQPPSVTLRGSLATFARLGAGGQAETLKAGELEIEGDAALGQRLQRIIGNLDLDWEEPLSRLFGDPVGHGIGRAARSVVDWHLQTFKTFGLNTSEYLQEELRLLPVQYEVDEFLNGVDSVRADVDRLAARVLRLKNKLST